MWKRLIQRTIVKYGTKLKDSKLHEMKDDFNKRDILNSSRKGIEGRLHKLDTSEAMKRSKEKIADVQKQSSSVLFRSYENLGVKYTSILNSAKEAAKKTDGLQARADIEKTKSEIYDLSQKGMRKVSEYRNILQTNTCIEKAKSGMYDLSHKGIKKVGEGGNRVKRVAISSAAANLQLVKETASLKSGKMFDTVNERKRNLSKFLLESKEKLDVTKKVKKLRNYLISLVVLLCFAYGFGKAAPYAIGDYFTVSNFNVFKIVI